MFADNGYESTKIIDIANECKIAKGSVYSYFKSKEEILVRIFLQEVTSMEFIASFESYNNILDAFVAFTNKLLVIEKETLKVVMFSTIKMLFENDNKTASFNAVLEVVKKSVIDLLKRDPSAQKVEDYDFVIRLLMYYWREEVAQFIFNSAYTIEDLNKNLEEFYYKLIEKRY